MVAINALNPVTTDNPPPPLLIFTSRAAGKVSELIAEEGNPELKLRVYVSGGGCSGFQYGFAFEETIEASDATLITDGVTLMVDPTSLQYLQGAEIDYQEGLEGSRFIIRNPNASASCSCGSSFSVSEGSACSSQQTH